MGLHWCKFLYK